MLCLGGHDQAMLIPCGDSNRTGAEQLCALLRGVRKRIKRLEDQSAALALTLEELRDIERQATESLEKIDRNGKDS